MVVTLFFSPDLEDLMLYILYSIADGEVVTPKVYNDYEIAAAEANQWHDVLVLRVEEPDASLSC